MRGNEQAAERARQLRNVAENWKTEPVSSTSASRPAPRRRVQSRRPAPRTVDIEKTAAGSRTPWQQSRGQTRWDRRNATTGRPRAASRCRARTAWRENHPPSAPRTRPHPYPRRDASRDQHRGQAPNRSSLRSRRHGEAPECAPRRQQTQASESSRQPRRPAAPSSPAGKDDAQNARPGASVRGCPHAGSAWPVHTPPCGTTPGSLAAFVPTGVSATKDRAPNASVLALG